METESIRKFLQVWNSEVNDKSIQWGLVQWSIIKTRALEGLTKLTLEKFSLIISGSGGAPGPVIGSPTSNSHWPWAPNEFLLRHLLTENIYFSKKKKKSQPVIFKYKCIHRQSITPATHQWVRPFSCHILPPFLFHLRKGSGSFFFLPTELVKVNEYMLNCTLQNLAWWH